jgi:LysR family transcriptional regulator, glycine cleavage system transcriptional activator
MTHNSSRDRASLDPGPAAATEPSLPPLDGLAAVLAVARTGSFTAAGVQMGLSHSSVSRRVQHVEDWMGGRLFERTGKGMQLTPAGSRLSLRIEDAFRLISTTAEPWRQPKGPAVVRVSVLPSLARLFLIPALPVLQDESPPLRIELVIEHRLADFEGDRIDFAIRYGPGPWPGLTARLLVTETLIPVASPRLAKQIGFEPDPTHLLGHPLLHDSDPSAWRLWLAARGVRLRARAIDRRFEDYDMVLAAAEAGLGVALLRQPLGLDRVASGALVRLAQHAVANPKKQFIVHPMRPPSTAALLCMQRIEQAMRVYGP